MTGSLHYPLLKNCCRPRQPPLVGVSRRAPTRCFRHRQGTSDQTWSTAFLLLSLMTPAANGSPNFRRLLISFFYTDSR